MKIQYLIFSIATLLPQLALADPGQMILRFEKISTFETRHSLCVNAINPGNGYQSKAMARETTIQLKSGRKLEMQEVAYGVDCESVDSMRETAPLYADLQRILDEPIEFKLELNSENPNLIESYEIQCLYGAEDCEMGFH